MNDWPKEPQESPAYIEYRLDRKLKEKYRPRDALGMAEPNRGGDREVELLLAPCTASPVEAHV